MKEEIRELVLSLGADLCGFADIAGFADAPAGFHPADIYPECKSVLAFAVALPRGLAKVEPRLIYAHYNDISIAKVDEIAFKAAKRIEADFGCAAVPMPCDGPYEYWDKENLEGRGLLSMKHIAQKAGLGSMGKNTLLTNERYGSFLTLGAILLSLDLDADEPAKNLCIAGCQKCVEACPVHAISDGTVNQKLCRPNTYGQNARGFSTVNCNRCRAVCPTNR